LSVAHAIKPHFFLRKGTYKPFGPDTALTSCRFEYHHPSIVVNANGRSMLDPQKKGLHSRKGKSKRQWSQPKVIVATECAPITETRSFVSPVEHHGSGTTIIGPTS